MNTEEVKVKIKITTFEELYDLAKKQFIEYEKVEGIDWKNYDFSIDTPEDQLKFKDMLQIRFIEELTEADEALRSGDMNHFKEEISDALNFFLAAMSMLGIDLNKLPKPCTSKVAFTVKVDIDFYQKKCWELVYKVGHLCNLLKNRPWSQSNYLVSMLDFNKRLVELWGEFWYFLSIWFTDLDIFEMFGKKYTVNKFRMRSGY